MTISLHSVSFYVTMRWFSTEKHKGFTVYIVSNIMNLFISWLPDINLRCFVAS